MGVDGGFVGLRPAGEQGPIEFGSAATLVERRPSPMYLPRSSIVRHEEVVEARNVNNHPSRLLYFLIDTFVYP